MLKTSTCVASLLSLTLSSASLSWAEEKNASQLRLFHRDSSLKNGIFVRTCAGDRSCGAQEVRIYRQSPEGLRPFEILYRDTGRLIQDGSSFLWQVDDKKIKVGSVEKEGLFLCSGSYEEVCDLNLSVKHPNGAAENAAEPVYLVEFSLRESLRKAENDVQSRTTLLPFIVPSPNQEDAGSCHYMAATGAMEILWNQSKVLHGSEMDTTLNGSSDLSEAFLMNIPNANNDLLRGCTQNVLKI